MRVHTLNVGPLQACCYVVAPSDGGEAAVIDPGGDAEVILDHLRYRELDLRLILLTHGHIDHVEAVAALKRALPEALVCIHEADAPMLGDPGVALASWIGIPLEPCEPGRLLADGDVVELGAETLEVLHTPGHTPGGISLLVRPVSAPGPLPSSLDPRPSTPDPLPSPPALLFSGDTLFAGGIGRTDFPGGSYAQLIESIRARLFALPDDTVVYPGHGEHTTIGEERRTNPFLR